MYVSDLASYNWTWLAATQHRLGVSLATGSGSWMVEADDGNGYAPGWWWYVYGQIKCCYNDDENMYTMQALWCFTCWAFMFGRRTERMDLLATRRPVTALPWVSTMRWQATQVNIAALQMEFRLIRPAHSTSQVHIYRVAQNDMPNQTICNIFTTSGQILKIL